MNKCYRISGTNASGKTTVVRAVMDTLGVQDSFLDGKYKIYKLKGDAYVLGSYENACGGLDTVKTFEDTKALALKYIEHGDVIMEGLLWSTVYKSSRELAVALREKGHDMYWLQLNTPLEVLLPRLMARRAAAGNYKDFDPSKVIDKFDAVARTYNKALETNEKGTCADIADLTRIIVVGSTEMQMNYAPQVPEGFNPGILIQTARSHDLFEDI